MPANTLADAQPQPLNENPAANDNADNPAQPVAARGEGAAVTPGFRVDDLGVWQSIATKEEGQEWFWFCSPLLVLAQVRDFQSTSWSLLVEVVDPDGNRHQTTFPRSLVVNDGGVVRERLSDLGLTMLPTAAGRAALNKYLSFANPTRRVTMVQTIGWHGKVFVLPDAAYGATAGTEVVFQGGRGDHSFRCAGTAEEWREKVALPVRGQSRILLTICVSFAAPFLKLVEGESGGVHLVGPSSTGKSTALYAAGSVSGGGGMRGNLNSWRATDNALEGIARAHSDTALMLDEIGQADARAVQAISYMLTNQQGKVRSTRDGGTRAPAEWRLTFVSTGEVSLADKLSEAGGRPMAGQAVRIVDVPLPDAGHGIFDTVPTEFASAAAFANYIQEASKTYYGSPIRLFLQQVAENAVAVADAVRTYISRFVQEHCPASADGQVQRVAERFGLFAAAGELAAQMGILPYEDGEAATAVARCFQAWLVSRGGTGSGEMLMAVQQVKEHLQRHATKHFDVWMRGAPGGDVVEAKALDRFGFRTKANGHTEFYATPAGFKKLCDGYDSKAVAKELIRQGILLPGKDGKSSKLVTIPGERKDRYYHLVPGEMEDEQVEVSAAA